MADLIDRDAVLKIYCDDCNSGENKPCPIPGRCHEYNLIKDAPAVNRWIPCSERLPEKDTSVIIYAAGHRVSAYYDAVDGVFRLTEENGLFYRKSAVTHWMPMPEPPEGGADDAT